MAGLQAVLLDALRSGQLDAFRNLLQMVDLGPNCLTTCVLEACTEDKPCQFLRALLRAKASPNLEDVGTGEAPIHVALSRMNLPAVWTLLGHDDLDVDVGDHRGDTPLHYVVKFVDDQHQAELLVRAMMRRNADVHKENGAGKSAIMEAAVLQKEKLVKVLLPENYTEKNITDGVTLKSFLQTFFPGFEHVVNVDRSNSDMLKLFRLLYAEKCDGFLNELQRLPLNARQMKLLLNMNDGKNTFLQTACMLSRPGVVVKALLDLGVDANLTAEGNGSPPLVMAAERKRYGVMELLLDVADVNQKDAEGNTALHVVAEDRNLEMVVKLLNAGARMDVKNNLGKDPISTAAMKDLMDMSLQRVDNGFKLSFGLFIQRQKRVTQPAPARDDPAMPSASLLDERIPLKQVKSPVQGDVETSLVNSASGDHSELTRLSYIMETHREDCIFKHPLVTSFVLLKLMEFEFHFRIRALITFLLHLYAFFYVLSRNEEMKIKQEQDATLFLVMKGLCWSLAVVVELFTFSTCPRKYFRQMKNLLPLGLVVLTPVIVVVPWENEPFVLAISMTTLFVGWSAVFVVVGQLYCLSAHLELFKIVVRNAAIYVFWYMLLFIPFPVSHMILKNTNMASNVSSTVNETKVSDMASDIFSMIAGNTDSAFSDYYWYALFSVFLYVGCVVIFGLYNMMTNMAVRGFSDVIETATLRRNRFAVRNMNDLERLFSRIETWRIPVISRMWSCEKVNIFTEDDDVYIFPSCKHYVFIGDEKGARGTSAGINGEIVKAVGAQFTSKCSCRTKTKTSAKLLYFA